MHSIAITKPFSRSFLIDRIVNNILGLKKVLNKPLLLESMDYNSYNSSNGYYEHICEPDFINEIINKTGCYYLLDIGHAQVSAKNLGYKSVYDYLKLLPIEKTIEIHLNHPKIYKNIGKDKHLPLTNNEVNLVLYLKPRLKKLKALNLEVFSKKEDILKQLKLIREKLILNL